MKLALENNEEKIESSSWEILKKQRTYKMCIIFSLFVLALFSILLSVSLGPLKIPLGEVIQCIFKNPEGINKQIIWNVRLPRTLIAAVVGMSLAVSGAILQGVMRNPLASPNIIGVSSGAGLAAVIILVLFPNYYYLVPPVAFIGALSSTLLIYVLAWKGGIKPLRMILAGVAVSSFLSAGINALMIFFPDRVHGVITFMVGGLAAKSWIHLRVMWIYAVIGVLLAFIFSNKINILMLGDEIAVSLGLKVERTRLMFIAIASLLAANAVSVVGLLGFVGLIVPHVARIIIGSDYRYLFPASALMGISLLVLCDTLARTIMDPVEIPVGIIMALIGAPFFLYLLRGGLNNNVKG
ncbi:FecCD family ABC transporter permease [Oceanirhabdus seepicola]|uniref:Iron ABC transporter permease n=1 Tax=Oceanirhabdus seepicola TaxID=2828781 RepID=A0A9J6NZY3_9CLOT|nr:iron ABC transporter permease [Oceanirhabdus seepicola]MCM1988720.1 iron ABC transporter permease [Oceanirhabdus seepicola]